ncbi:helix-turn-helix domain-containing protein [Endozoicomonas ascidiicola]|uniref:helix-turn-helix domain-containing protein n=1 Tax=Endozoicomonas ascidiicola TaxID=1698521 RepID=UPI00082BF153|nr:helix-turn-helix transcriptional regulator [Endozoicomonas ascidiicola]
MIRIRFRQFLDDKSFKEKRKINLDLVAKETGIGRATVNRLANSPGANFSLNVVDALCKYFGCDPGELLQHIDD